MHIRTLIRVSAVLYCLSSLVAWGQGFGVISGTISDPVGASIPSANVTVTEVSTGQDRKSVV